MKTTNLLQLLIVAVLSSMVLISCSQDQEEMLFNADQPNGIVSAPLKVRPLYRVALRLPMMRTTCM
jgi:uncharacterized lipoprotein YehR (DUF1307 family)